MNGFDPFLLTGADATVAADVAVLAAGDQVDGLDVPGVSDLAWRGGVDAREAALLQALHRAVAELHLDRAAVHEVQLLLDVVKVKARFDAGRQDDRVDAERRHAQALADLAEAGAIAEVVEVADRIALALGHSRVVSGSLHVVLLSSYC